MEDNPMLKKKPVYDPLYPPIDGKKAAEGLVKTGPDNPVLTPIRWYTKSKVKPFVSVRDLSEGDGRKVSVVEIGIKGEF